MAHEETNLKTVEERVENLKNQIVIWKSTMEISQAETMKKIEKNHQEVMTLLKSLINQQVGSDEGSSYSSPNETIEAINTIVDASLFQTPQEQESDCIDSTGCEESQIEDGRMLGKCFNFINTEYELLWHSNCGNLWNYVHLENNLHFNLLDSKGIADQLKKEPNIEFSEWKGGTKLLGTGFVRDSRGITGNSIVIGLNGLLNIDMSTYSNSISKGVAIVMESYSCCNGQKMDSSSYFVVGILRNKMKFRGFVISDWQDIDRITSYPHAIYLCPVRAGVRVRIDMVMVLNNFTQFMDELTYQVDLYMAKEFDSQEHKEIAREAVRKSLVLLKGKEPTDNSFFCLCKKIPKIFLVARNDDSLEHQYGGWTITWQCLNGHDLTCGTTILNAITFTTALFTQIVYNENSDVNLVKFNNFSYVTVVVGDYGFTSKLGTLLIDLAKPIEVLLRIGVTLRLMDISGSIQVDCAIEIFNATKVGAQTLVMVKKAVAWTILGMFSIIRFEIDYVLVVRVCFGMSIANIIGFTKCRKDAKMQIEAFSSETIALQFTFSSPISFFCDAKFNWSCWNICYLCSCCVMFWDFVFS